MTGITELLQGIGHLSLNTLWFPLLIWSACALLVHVGLKSMQKGDVLYHYHLRVALVAGIPLGILASGMTAAVNTLFASASASSRLSFIVIQNPIAVTPESTSKALIDWGDPYLWIGLVTFLLLAVGIGQLVSITWNYYQISGLTKNLDTRRLHDLEFDEKLLGTIHNSVDIVYSPLTEVPFTFGWRNPVIVIPSYLKEYPQKLRMAVRHELMHIRRGDFLVNGFIMAMKALFWFHPLIHLFHHDIKEYREISCDTEVLSDRTISRKAYAQLLFELAPKREHFARNIVSMAVNQSSLKKRIDTMKNITAHNRPIVKSVLISLGLLVGISGFIACSDLQDSGITNTDIEDAQNRLQEAPADAQPLIIFKEDTDLDGTIDKEKVMSYSNGQSPLSRVSPKDVRAVEVLKGEQALQKYGAKGKDGVIIVTVLDIEKALNSAPSQTKVQPAENGDDSKKTQKEDFFVVVEEMPRLKGGLESIQQCVEYPDMARKEGIEGRVIVQFIVNEEGRVENPTVVRGIGAGADEEALRCVRQAEFIPGKQRGQPVRVQYALPIQFKLPTSINEETSSVYLERPKVEGKQLAIEQFTQSNNGTVSGKVIDKETGHPMGGVNIVIAGTSTGTTTNSDGEFNLDLSGISTGENKLTFSYIGYQSITAEI